MYNVALAETAGDTGLSSFISSITGSLGDFSPANLALVLVAALGLTVGLTLSWFAFRWIIRKIQSALKKGKLG